MSFSLPLVITFLLPILFFSVGALRLPPVGIGLSQGGVNNAASGTSDLESKGQQQADYLLPNQFVDTRRKYSCAFDYDRYSLSMREARIKMPLMALLSSVASASSSPAFADTLIPSSSFDLSLKAFFPTALTSKETADRIVRVLKDR
jgi:hypothetical protein